MVIHPRNGFHAIRNRLPIPGPGDSAIRQVVDQMGHRTASIRGDDR
jgi:hypothetical protein